MSQPQLRSKPNPACSIQEWNSAERQAQADRVVMRAAKQRERRKVATSGSPRRRKSDC